LRPDLKILRTGPRDFRLVDPASGNHFAIRADERFLFDCLARHDAWPQALAAYQAKFGFTLSQREAEEFVEQLRLQGLLVQEEAGWELAEKPDHEGRVICALRGDAVNHCFDVLTLFFGWLVQPPMLLLLAPLFLIEAAIVWHHWQEGLTELEQLWRRLPPLPLLMAAYLQTVCLLDLPMALLTGIACRALRGRVMSFAVTWGNWVLPTFSFTTNVGESIVLFDRRSCRHFLMLNFLTPIALSGIYAILWRSCSPTSHARLFWLMMVPCSAVVFLYQFNIFSPYTSGCWLLSKAAGDWNLRNRALAETRAWALVRTSPAPITRRERFWLRTYGVGIYLTRFAIDLVLLFGGGYALTNRYGAGGAVGFCLLFVWWNRSYLGWLWRLTTFRPRVAGFHEEFPGAGSTTRRDAVSPLIS
jgi:hypothetical protein